MSDDRPTIELDPRVEDDPGILRDQPDEQEVHEAYLRLFFENYDEDILREVMGDEKYESYREEYDELLADEADEGST